MSRISNMDTKNMSPQNWFFIKHQYEPPSPISFPPLLNLQSDIDRIEAAEDRDVGEYAAQN